jgi:hypothetical protein
MTLFIIILSIIIILYAKRGHIPYKCNHCKDTGEIEVMVMGTDDTRDIPCICLNSKKIKRKQKLDYLLGNLNK